MINQTNGAAVPEIAVDRTSAGYRITRLHADGVDRVGTFRSIADAWTAVDALDCAQRVVAA